MFDHTKIEIRNHLNGNSLPAGGTARLDIGFTLRPLDFAFQDGPLGANGARNGALIEDLLWIAHKRLAFFQSTACACEENVVAMAAINDALCALARRSERVASEGGK